jgi:hypothetical protein
MLRLALTAVLGALSNTTHTREASISLNVSANVVPLETIEVTTLWTDGELSLVRVVATTQGMDNAGTVLAQRAVFAGDVLTLADGSLTVTRPEDAAAYASAD